MGTEPNGHEIRPYVILDASFILGPINLNNSYQEFVSLCFYLNNLGRKARVRLIPQIREEIERYARKNANDQSDFISQGLLVLSEIEDKLMFSHEEHQLFQTLFKNIDAIGKKLGDARDRGRLSYRDDFLSAYALVKSRKGDVVLATRDRTLIKTMGRAYNIAHPFFLSQGFPDSKLYFAGHRERLEDLMDNIPVYFA